MAVTIDNDFIIGTFMIALDDVPDDKLPFDSITIDISKQNEDYFVTIIGQQFHEFNKEAGSYYTLLKRSIEKTLKNAFLKRYRIQGTIVENKVISNYSEKYVIILKTPKTN